MIGRVEDVPDLLGPLEAQIRPPKHQKRRDRPGSESLQDQGQRQKNDELVEKRSPGDLPYDRQLAIGREPVHVFRCDRGIVDHSACSLRRGLHRLTYNVIDRRGRNLRDPRDIVEKCQKTAHTRLINSYATPPP